MATKLIYTSSDPNLSSAPAACPAHELDAKQRSQLAVEALVRTEPLSELAERHQVSRKFVYQQADKATQALEQAFNPPQKKEAVLFYLPVTKTWLKQVILGLILLCHSSYRGVIEFFQDLLDMPVSMGTIHNVVREAVDQAQQCNATEDLSRVRVGAHDELFQANLPVLAGIDLDSTYCYLLVSEAHRDAETWAIHLLDLNQQGLRPEHTVADAGSGLRAGQALAWPTVPCHGDVFHILHEATQLAGRLEKRAYSAMAKREDLEQKMAKAKQKKQGRAWSKQLARARAQETERIRLADEVGMLIAWLRCDILVLNALEAETRRALYDFVTDVLHTLESLDSKRIRPLRRSLENQRESLLAFAAQLDQGLQALAQRFELPVIRLRELLELQHIAPTRQAYWTQATRLHQQLHDQFWVAQKAVRELTQRIHRASSLVENFNGRLRNYFFLRRQVGSRYLDLLRFFLNHRPLLRSYHPERVGKTPAELLTGHKHPPWLELLGFKRFSRLNEAV